MPDSIPPLRGPDGLLLNVTYPRFPDGHVNWRGMLRPEHLYVNPDFEDELKMKFGVKSRRDIDVTKCADHQLLVLQEGWNHLCEMRGLEALIPGPITALPGEIHTTCTVKFVPNFENPLGLTVGDSASASLYSVSGSFQLHLAAMAFNRAFARAVRRALRIPIYGKDEYDPKANKEYENALKEGKSPIVAASKAEESPEKSGQESGFFGTKPQDDLARRCAKLNKKGSHTFEKIKAAAIANPSAFETDPNTWTGFDTIPNRDVFTLLDKIQQAAENGKTKT